MQYIYATRNALLDGSPAIVAQTVFVQLIYNDDPMPVQFLTSKQRANYGRYVGDTVRFLGTFLEDPADVPSSVLQTLVRQLRVTNLDQLPRYCRADQRWEHTAEIRSRYGFCDFSDPAVGFRLSRWLYALCWTGTEQPSVLFDRATTWLLAHKVLLPGCTTLENAPLFYSEEELLNVKGKETKIVTFLGLVT